MEHIQVRNPLTYEEILGWRGFSFETSRTRDMYADYLARDGEYGIAESERIIDNVVCKGKALGVQLA